MRRLYWEEKREANRKHPLVDTADKLRQVINGLKRVKDLMSDQRHLLKVAGVPKKKVDATGHQEGKRIWSLQYSDLGFFFKRLMITQ